MWSPPSASSRLRMGLFRASSRAAWGAARTSPLAWKCLVDGSWKSLPALVRRCSDPGPTFVEWCRYRALTRPFYLRKRFRLAFGRVPSLPVKPGVWCCHRSSSTLVKMDHLGSHSSFCGSAPRPTPSKGDGSARPKLGFEAEPLAFTVHRHSRGGYCVEVRWSTATRVVIDRFGRRSPRFGSVVPGLAPLAWPSTEGVTPVWEVEVHPCVDSPARLATRDARASNLPLDVAVHLWKSIKLPAKALPRCWHLPGFATVFAGPFPGPILRCGTCTFGGGLWSLPDASSRSSMAVFEAAISEPSGGGSFQRRSAGALGQLHGCEATRCGPLARPLVPPWAFQHTFGSESDFHRSSISVLPPSSEPRDSFYGSVSRPDP